jgi:hypothetical protein
VPCALARLLEVSHQLRIGRLIRVFVGKPMGGHTNGTVALDLAPRAVRFLAWLANQPAVNQGQARTVQLVNAEQSSSLCVSIV